MAEATQRIVPEVDQESAQPPPPAFAKLAKGDSGSAAVTVNLPDGRIAVLERPKGSIIARVIRIAAGLVEAMDLGGKAQLIALDSMKPYVEALLHVKVLGESNVIPIMTGEQYQALADNLGDEGVLEVVTAVVKHWGRDSDKDVEVIKK